jgi:hypothetical protein
LAINSGHLLCYPHETEVDIYFSVTAPKEEALLES